MINLKSTTSFFNIDVGTPLAYEYDSDTQSIVIPEGYVYTIYYNNDSGEYKETIDLTQS